MITQVLERLRKVESLLNKLYCKYSELVNKPNNCECGDPNIGVWKIQSNSDYE